MPTCDVRDVAEAHLKAMILPEARNNRHIICSTKNCVSILDIAKMLHEEFSPKNYKIPTTRAPNFLLRLGGIFSKTVASVNLKIPNKYF